jgi:hypothetical protein
VAADLRQHLLDTEDMSVRKIQDTLSVLAGLLVAPTVWAINMQLGQILPYTDCARQSGVSAIISFVGAAVAVVTGAISWRWAQRERIAALLTATSSFVARLGALSALIFGFALSMQGIASLVLSGCER